MNARQHLARLHELPCVVHWLRYDGIVRVDIQVHHLESIRDDMSHYAGIPICPDCHALLHRESRRGFERMTKLTPIDLLAGTIALIVGAT